MGKIQYGIGSAFGHTLGTFGGELLRAGAHGAANGLIGTMDGHGFGTGFVSGFMSSMAGSGMVALGVNSGFVLSQGCSVIGGLSSMAMGDSFSFGFNIGGNVGSYNHGWVYDGNGNKVTYMLDEIVVTGHRNAAGKLLGATANIVAVSEIMGREILAGSNGKLYFRHANGKIFRGNQYVKTRSLKMMPYAKISGTTLNILSEFPSVAYAAN